MRIGAIAEDTGLSVATIRFYESAGLLGAIRRRPSGYREYGSEELARLRFVQQAKRVGLSLADIGSIVRLYDRHEPTCVHVRALLDQKLTEVDAALRDLRILRRALEGLRDEAGEHVDCRPSGGRICGIIERADSVVSEPALRVLAASAGGPRGHRGRPTTGRSDRKEIRR